MIKKLVYCFVLVVILVACGKADKLGDCEPVVDCIPEGFEEPDYFCIQVYDPVCGCDCKTYSNSCHATRAGVSSYTAGECD